MPHLPVNIHNIKDNFEKIFFEWNNLLPSDLLNVLIVDKFYNKVHAGYQQFCIIVAIIGGWQVLHGQDQTYNTRYEKFLSETLPDNDVFTDGEDVMHDGKIIAKKDGMKEKLAQVLGAGKTFKELGEDIDGIRDCILHWDNKLRTPTKTDKQFKKYQPIIEKEVQISNLCEILFILMIKAIYTKIGITLTNDEKKNLLRYVTLWSSYSL